MIILPVIKFIYISMTISSGIYPYLKPTIFMKVRPSIAIVENNHLLLMQYHYGNTDVYNLPGGNVDKGETLMETVVRELMEELGIEVEVGDMILSGDVIMPEGKEDVLHCVFEGKILSGKPILNPKETSALAVVWMPLVDLHELEMYPNVGAELQRFYLKGRGIDYIGKIGQKWF
jgi:8-oxo-dGTP diphosphatase